MSNHHMGQKAKRRRTMRLWSLQDGRCAHCGIESEGPFLGTLDHIIPRSRGGPNAYTNLLWSCRPCNEEKADRYELSARAEMYRARIFAWLESEGHSENLPAGWVRAGQTWSLEPERAQ